MHYDGYERQHMWHQFGGRGHSVMIVIAAKDVSATINKYVPPYKARFRYVDYMTSEDANELHYKTLAHSANPENAAYLDPTQTWFMKNIAYRDEREIRALLFRGHFRRSYLNWFANLEGLQWEFYQGDRPWDYPIVDGYLRLFIGDEGSWWRINMTDAQAEKLIEYMNADFVEAFPELGVRGMHVNFQLSSIKEIVFSPSLAADVPQRQLLRSKILRLAPSVQTRDSGVQSWSAR